MRSPSKGARANPDSSWPRSDGRYAGYWYVRVQAAPGWSELEGIITSGFFEVTEEGISVVAETLELQGEIDLDRANEPQKQAEEALKAADFDEHSSRNISSNFSARLSVNNWVLAS